MDTIDRDQDPLLRLIEWHSTPGEVTAPEPPEGREGESRVGDTGFEPVTSSV